jgi:dynein heavy chain
MMSFSPFKAHFEEEITEWEDTLKLIMNTTEEWMKVQLEWMYLSPIFSAKDIAMQLKEENKKFININKFWRREMNYLLKRPNVLLTCTKDGLFEELKDKNDNLE